MTHLWFQTSVNVLLHIKQVLQKTSPHSQTHWRVSGDTGKSHRETLTGVCLTASCSSSSYLRPVWRHSLTIRWWASSSLFWLFLTYEMGFLRPCFSRTSTTLSSIKRDIHIYTEYIVGKRLKWKKKCINISLNLFKTYKCPFVFLQKTEKMFHLKCKL